MRKLLMLCLLAVGSNQIFAADDWVEIGTGNEDIFYMSKSYMKPVKSYAGSSIKIEAWVKSVIYNDIVKDGRSVGDYTQTLFEFDCTSETIKPIQNVNYNKNGSVQNSYESPYPKASRVVPNTHGETWLNIACAALDKLN